MRIWPFLRRTTTVSYSENTSNTNDATVYTLPTVHVVQYPQPPSDWPDCVWDRACQLCGKTTNCNVDFVRQPSGTIVGVFVCQRCWNSEWIGLRYMLLRAYGESAA